MCGSYCLAILTVQRPLLLNADPFFSCMFKRWTIFRTISQVYLVWLWGWNTSSTSNKYHMAFWSLLQKSQLNVYCRSSITKLKGNHNSLGLVQFNAFWRQVFTSPWFTTTWSISLSINKVLKSRRILTAQHMNYRHTETQLTERRLLEGRWDRQDF